MPSHLKTNCQRAIYNWLLNSPILMNMPAALNGQQWLRSITAETDPLTETEHQRRLGLWYEDQVHALLMASSMLQQVYRNIQVKNDGRTLGEFDFLCVDQAGETRHLECAIKFYLCDGPADRLDSYVGPNRKDRLSKKWQQMSTRQIELGNTEAGAATCQQLGIAAPSHRHLLIQGILFYPFTTFIQSEENHLHQAISSAHNRGWWARVSELPELTSDGYQLLIRYKPDWLLSIDGGIDEPQWLTADTALKAPLMVSRVKEIEKGNWKEIDRGFVVPEDWGVPSD